MNREIPFRNLVEDDIQLVDKLIYSQISKNQPELEMALDFILSAGGKRIRPTIILLVGKMLHGPKDVLITLAAAIEALHTATLIHDDLIDGSLLRRGIPTLNSKWNAGATVLTGDLLFAIAANLAANTNSIRAMKMFSKTLTEIVDGEVSQLLSDRCKVSKPDYYSRIYSKTASLFKTSTTTAAILSSSSEDMIDHMSRFGEKIGIAFQIIDDILDFTGEQVTVGKPIGSDLRQGIITLPAIIYIEDHPQDPNIMSFTKGECLKEQHQIETLVASIRNSDAIVKSFDESKNLIEEALVDLHTCEFSPERQALEELAQYIVQRDF